MRRNVARCSRFSAAVVLASSLSLILSACSTPMGLAPSDVPSCPAVVIQETIALEGEVCIPSAVVDHAMGELLAGRWGTAKTLQSIMGADHPCMSDEALSALAGHCSALEEVRR